MFMRIARREDVDSVYNLANDPIIRQMSFSSNNIAYEDHVRWFEKKINDPNCLFYLFFDGINLVAQIRFERYSYDSAKVSISIALSYRGQGLAKDFMAEALAAACAKWRLSEVRALVKVDNVASNKFFLKCGFVFEKIINHKGYESNVYIYRFKARTS